VNKWKKDGYVNAVPFKKVVEVVQDGHRMGVVNRGGGGEKKVPLGMQYS